MLKISGDVAIGQGLRQIDLDSVPWVVQVRRSAQWCVPSLSVWSRLAVYSLFGEQVVDGKVSQPAVG